MRYNNYLYLTLIRQLDIIVAFVGTIYWQLDNIVEAHNLNYKADKKILFPKRCYSDSKIQVFCVKKIFPIVNLQVPIKGLN